MIVFVWWEYFYLFKRVFKNFLRLIFICWVLIRIFWIVLLLLFWVSLNIKNCEYEKRKWNFEFKNKIIYKGKYISCENSNKDNK